MPAADSSQPSCIGGDCRPDWNWRRPDCPIHGDPNADKGMSEQLERAAGHDGALTLSFTMVVLPSLVPELRAEGEKKWLDSYHCPPQDWGSDEEYVRYALARRLRDAGE
jgi:hypothetical protein